MDFFTGSEKLFTDEPQAEDTKIKEDDSEIVAMIKEIIDSRIRPVVQEDGGDIEYKTFNEETGVYLIYLELLKREYHFLDCKCINERVLFRMS